MFILENRTVKLRAVEPSDAELIYKWENDTQIWQAGDTIAPYSRFDVESYIMSERDIYANKQLRFMTDAKVGENLITVGAADLYDFNPFHKRAAVGILTYPFEYRRKGYAASALKLLINYAFDPLDVEVLYCNISATNTVGVGCMQKAGFEICGLKKRWNKTKNGREDEYTMQLIRK